jgi:carbon-monoxide dehydrogenase large subunit
VVAVVTHADLTGLQPAPLATRPPGARAPSMPVLACDRVRYVGEPVAAVVATRPEVARDALDQLSADATYEPLPAVVGPAADAPVVHPDYPDNVCYRWSETVGDVDAAFAEAAHVVRLRIQNNRVAPVALEPPACSGSPSRRSASSLPTWAAASGAKRRSIRRTCSSRGWRSASVGRSSGSRRGPKIC